MLPIQPVILTTPGRRLAFVQSLKKTLSETADFLAPLVKTDQFGEGAARATQKAISAAALASPGAAVLLLEDDVVAHSEATSVIPNVVFPINVAVISFCDMREVEEYAPDGFYERSALGSDGRGWWGNQSLLIHPETARVLSAADWFAPEIETSRGVVAHKAAYADNGRNCSDIRLSLIVHSQPHRNRYAVHVPSLFLHVGDDSLCFPGRGMGERSTRNWLANRQRYGIY